MNRKTSQETDSDPRKERSQLDDIIFWASSNSIQPTIITKPTVAMGPFVKYTAVTSPNMAYTTSLSKLRNQN